MDYSDCFAVKDEHVCVHVCVLVLSAVGGRVLLVKERLYGVVLRWLRAVCGVCARCRTASAAKVCSDDAHRCFKIANDIIPRRWRGVGDSVIGRGCSWDVRGALCGEGRGRRDGKHNAFR